VADDTDLVAALTESQRLGFLGARPIEEVIEHARAFVGGLDGLPIDARVIDLGSGGGVPGLVIAHDRPALRVTLLDRRTKRTDFLERVVRRLGWADRVSIVASDVTTFDPVPLFDAAVARGFGPPAETLAAAARVVRAGGRVVISEPPSGDRWEPEVVTAAGVERITHPGSTVAVFLRLGEPAPDIRTLTVD
jgi:16S rRNA (guanine527-N7)-methyltransferase